MDTQGTTKNVRRFKGAKILFPTKHKFESYHFQPLQDFLPSMGPEFKSYHFQPLQEGCESLKL